MQVNRSIRCQRIVQALVGMACLLALSATASAQSNYPNRPIRMVVAFAPGGPNDVMARVLAASLTPIVGQQVVVDNRPGAGGVIGNAAVANAAHDGYTLLFASAPFTMAPALTANLPYDTERDFTAVTKVASSPMVLMVNASASFTTAAALLQHAKTNPGKINYGSGGIASTPHLATEALALVSSTKMTHVPYKGGGPALTALQGGEIDILFDSITSSLAPIQDGKVRALAVSTPARAAHLPAVPTLAEVGFANFPVTHWVGVVAPSRTPPDVQAKLHADILKALRSPELAQRFAAIGAEPVGDTAQEFQAFIKAELARWPKIVKEAGIEPQ
jgi:tripartite-type tricarboxylate transporter receptor subunit TctC